MAADDRPRIGSLDRELFTLMLDLWDLLVEENGVPGSVGEHLSKAVTAGRELLAAVDVEEPDTTGAQGEAESANPPDASPAKPRPPRATRSKQGTL